MLSRTSSSSSSSSAIGDYIGTESCLDVLSADEEYDVVSSVSDSLSRFRYGGRRKEEREARAAAARQFPPPIPLLAQTENLLPHMPWVLKRVVTSDGRLILREEKVRHHEYFRAHRSNGRLTLHLVPLDDDVFQDNQIDQEEIDDLDHRLDNVNNKTSSDEVDDFDSEDGCRKVILAAMGEETVVGGGGGGSPRGKCLKSCFVGMGSVREIRPVLS